MKSKRPVFLGALAIVLGALAAYHNSFLLPFQFDDLPSILDNPSITSLATAWSPPQAWGFTVSGRPVLNFTLALNYAVSGTDVWSYHALNWLIHVCAGLVLFGIVRRTLARIAEKASPVNRLLHDDWIWPAFVVALLWTVHPLQTESVTYVIQRAESLMGLFYLLTLYGFVRAMDSSRPTRWLAVSVAACLLGTGAKEVIVTAPVIVLFFDRTFVAGSFAAAWRARWKYYFALAATWLPLAWLVAGTGGDRGGTFAYTPAAFGAYWLTQFEALARYLQLSVWPTPLVFDYGSAEVQSLPWVALWALPVLALLGATAWALVRRPAAAFLGAAFFLILSPTSVVPGVTQVIVEHRMYLPLAAVLAALILPAMVAWRGRVAHWTAGALAVVAVVAIGLTIQRNGDYRDDLALWQDTLEKRPGNARAYNNVGTAYFNRGEFAQALGYFEESVRRDPESAHTRYNLGQTLQKLGRLEDAVRSYREAVRRLTYLAQAHLKMGQVLVELGRPAEAVAPLTEAASLLAEPAEAYAALGRAWFEQGRIGEALASYERALQLKPTLADAQFNFAVALMAAGRVDDARGRFGEAVKLKPEHAQARLNLGVLFAQSGQLTEALAQLQEAVKFQPGLAEAQANLGIVLAELGRPQEAVAHYEAALRVRPEYAVAHYNLGNALLQLQRWSEAKRHFAEAARLKPDFEAAQEMVARMREVP